MIIQERDGDAWGQNDITRREEKGLDSGFILEEEPSRWIGGVMEREGSRKMVALQMGRIGAGAHSGGGGEDQNSLDLLGETCLLNTKGEMWKGSWIYKSRMEGRVLGWRDTLGSCQHVYDL